MKTICAFCEKPVVRTLSELKKSKSGRNFCSKQCAAKHNNIIPKRKKTKKCRICKNLIFSQVSYCIDCYTAKHYLKDKTLAEAIKNRQDANRYTGIRGNARKIYEASEKTKCCAVCGYKKHFHICHIKDIAKFSLGTLISTINDINNLVALCPTHHWELDHDELDKKSVGLLRFERRTKAL